MIILLLAACTAPTKAPRVASDSATDSAGGESAEEIGPDTADTPDGAALLVTEVMSDNGGVLTDAEGDSPDWLEIMNPGPDPVDLEGWTLTDDGDTSYTFPVTTMLGGQYLVVFASGKDPAPEGELHAPFALDADGDSLTLARPDGSVAHAVEVPALPRDVSWGLGQSVTSADMFGDGSAGKLATAEAKGWTGSEFSDAAFDDAAWTDVILGVGFDGTVAGAESVDAAFGKPTEQSSDFSSWTGAEAVDGDPATFSHTNTADFAPWWEVDLEADYEVTAIDLLNRTGCCPERLHNVVVTVSDADGAVLWTSDTINPVASDEPPTDPGTAFSLAVEPPVIGRTVRVSKTAVGGTYEYEWLSLAEVAVTATAVAPYTSAITTEIPAGAAAWLRVPFAVTEAPSRATLSVAYDDGYAAWIDGVEAAEANAGEGIATAEHDGLTTETFPLDPRLLTAGDHVFAAVALNVSADDDDLLFRPSLVAETIATGAEAYFDTPTPGEPNGEGFDGFLDEPMFDPPRGFYDSSFTATITSPTSDATLVYTLDGSAPTLDNGTAVTGDTTVDIATTTVLRAAAFRDGYAASDVATHTYLFLADVLRQPAAPDGLPTTWDGLSEAAVSADYEMDPEIVDADPEALLDALRSIPTLSIVADPNDLFGADDGLYIHSAERGDEWEKPASVEWILPDGSTGFQEDCGVLVHGWGWRYHSSTKKHSLRLEFSRDYGVSKLEYPVFADAPVERFDSLVLRAGGSKTWLDFRDPAQAQYLHDSFARDTARDMGKADGHATYVHLYLNGLYWGLYNPVERPEADFGAEYFGGDADEYDAINRRTTTNEAVDGTLDAYEELLARAEADLSTDAGLEAVEEMLDLEDLIDYMLIHQYTVNRDGPCCFESNNMRGLRRRADGEKFRFFVWDMEYSLWDATDATNVTVDVDGSISHVYTRLWANDAFRARYAARARTHLTEGGALTPEVAAARYEARADEIFAALLAESARWGDTYREAPYTRDVEWQAEYDRLMTEYFPSRTDALIDQLTAVGLYEP